MHRKTWNSHEKGSDQTGFFFLRLYCDNQCIFWLDLSMHFENEALHYHINLTHWYINVYANISFFFFTQQIARWTYCNTITGKIVRDPSWLMYLPAYHFTKQSRNWMKKLRTQIPWSLYGSENYILMSKNNSSSRKIRNIIYFCNSYKTAKSEAIYT